MRKAYSFRGRCRLALITALIVPALAAASPAAAYEAKDCEQADKAWLALRACSAMLEAPDLAKEDRVRFLIKRSEAWIIEDDTQEAVSDYTKVIEIDAANAVALKGRAGAYTKLADHKSAAADWSILVEQAKEPTQQEAYLLERAMSWLAAGNPDAALADYAKLLELNPKNLKAHVGRGNVFAASGDKEKALAEYDLAQKIDATDWSTYIARGQAAERWGDTKLAIENYSIIVKGNTRSAAPWRQALKRLGVDTPP